MMSPGLLGLAALATIAFPLSAFATEQGFFAGLDVSGGAAFGSSRTTNGGAPFAGGGVVGNVKLGEVVGVGGHVGYRFDPAMSAFISYQHSRGDIGWEANFPLYGVSSRFEGEAISNAILGNVAYEFPLSDATSIRTTAGLGMTFNTLSQVVETDKPTGIFVADLANHTKIGAAAQVGLGLRHKIASNVVVGLDGLIAYADGFETGNARSGNLGITDINPYRIDDVWRATLSASIKVDF
ncbi:conserved hypothetical protein [Nitrobacter hamburgensis X14]|uniref:Uncharacterized protein n=1 Tax=Nitrobacter hamburgensis (strain DSM 10229 / NCIMB 13809 / X14) TaxID=323097 RepID=Q1QMJ1_NITHX|nr:outer membrane beta-barrel protein [Nitrobacter hamburgensis]ABE62556.1 conserved hypothetical protein [Nitrobacter hamburgensis X14]